MSAIYRFCLVFLYFIPFLAQAQPCREIVGYYPNWQWYDRGKLVRPTTLKYEKYSVINYSFFKPNPDGTIVSGDTWADENLLQGQINWSTSPVSYYPNTSIVDLAHQKGVKVLIAVGGWSWSNDFPTIAASPTKRAKFASECKRLINFYKIDGIDLDWEYPGYADHNGSPADKQNFTLFVKTIRDTLNTLGASQNRHFMLTSCFAASRTGMANIEWNNVVPLLDCLNIMSYDFFGTWDATTNHNSPLFAPAQGEPTFNVASAVEFLMTNYNVPANKINAGVAFYGRSAKTTSAPSLHGPQSGGADKITFATDDGTPMYYNLLEKMNLFTKQFDAQAQVPYLLGNNGLNTFVSYDDPASIAAKGNYIRNKNLRGAIIWEITGDYIETAPNSGIIASTPLADALNNAFCNATASCDAPTNLTVIPNNTSASLTWTNMANNNVELQYKTAAATTWTTISQGLTANAYTIINLATCTNYEFRLRSICGSQSSTYSAVKTFSTSGCNTGGGGTGTGGTFTSTCTSPNSFFFNANNYAPLGEIKIGQGRLYPIWGVSVDAHIPSNRMEWAMSMVHAAHLFRNVSNTASITPSFYFATAAKESFCGCDQNIAAMPNGTAFPFTFQSASLGDGCFQIENNSAYNEMIKIYPQRFPVGQHANLIGNANFATAALGKAYYDIFTMKYWEIHKGWNPSQFFNQATDPNAAIKLMAVAYNRGLWYTGLQKVLKDERNTAITATTISPYFIDNNYGYDYQNALTTYTRVLDNQANTLPSSATAVNPQTNQPYNFFTSFYDPQVAWGDVSNYIDKIMPMYPTINSLTLKSTVKTTFDGINSGNSISFRYQMGQVLNTLILNLPADDPSANIAVNYGCFQPTAVNQLPLVTLTSPTNNATFAAPAAISLAATASDADGTIAKVEFYQGTTLLATKTVAPYTHTWSNVAAGTYSLTAKAYDDKNAVTTSTSVTCKINTPANKPPVVTLTPFRPNVFILPTTVTLTADASDVDGSITKVEFYRGTRLITTVNIAPYTYQWTNPPTGIYTITAKAYDNSGAVKTSVGYPIVVQRNTTTVPSVTITSPANNSNYLAPASVTIAASASIGTGTIQYVEFYQGSTLLGTDNTFPYTFNWSNVAAGNYSIVVKAFSSAGEKGESMPVNISVSALANKAPICSISSNLQTTTAPGSVMLTAAASDPDGTISRVELYENGRLVSTLTAAPFVFSRSALGAGTYSFLAKAYDDKNAITASNTVSITVQTPVNQLPTCSLSSNLQTTTAPGNVTLTAAASDPDGTISKVELYQNNQLVTTLTAVPFVFSRSALGAGTYSFLAKAYDNQNAVTASNTVSITVQTPVNQLPTCSLSSNLQTTTAPGNVTLTAAASDPDGTVSKVELYQNNQLVTTLTAAPFVFSRSALGAGTYSFLAKAYDDKNAVAASNTVNVIVQQTTTGTGCVGVANYAANTTYQQGSQVQNNGTLYTCNVAGWCSGPASAYAPGTGWAWQQAWSSNGDCGSGNTQPPTVTWTSPGYNATFGIGASIPCTVAWSNQSGTLSKIEILQGNNVVGVLQNPTSSPSTIYVTFMTAGVYGLVAKATNSANLSTTSAFTQVIVQQQNGACGVAMWSATGTYVAGDKAYYNGQLWQAQWWTQGDTPGVVATNGSTPWVSLGGCSPMSNGGVNARVALAPNPTNGQLLIKLSNIPKNNVNIVFLDILGRICYKANVENFDSSFSHELNMEKLNDGIYQVVISAGEWKSVQKIWKVGG